MTTRLGASTRGRNAGWGHARRCGEHSKTGRGLKRVMGIGDFTQQDIFDIGRAEPSAEAALFDAECSTLPVNSKL